MSEFVLTGSVILNAAGGGEVDLAPRSNDDYVVTHATVSVTSANAEPTAKIYRDVVSANSFREGSYTGSNDASDTRYVLRHGSGRLICVWAGGDPGAQATYTVSGVLYPPGTAPRE